MNLKIVKTTDLTECPKCHKMITNKTLKYSHAKTCGIVKQPPDISAIKPVNFIKQQPPDISAIKQQPPDISAIKRVSAIKQLNTVNNKPRSLSPQKKK